jgi:hypothetical protein
MEAELDAELKNLLTRARKDPQRTPRRKAGR